VRNNVLEFTKGMPEVMVGDTADRRGQRVGQSEHASPSSELAPHSTGDCCASRSYSRRAGKTLAE
jgi:hypothetical protein